MAITLVLIRHGNTFDKGDVIRRVGCGTDLPLSSSGVAQVEKLGVHLKSKNLLPCAVITSALRRTQETAAGALAAAHHTAPQRIDTALNELNYGPDEGKPEDDVVARLGAPALALWEAQNIMPDGWSPRPEIMAAQAHTLMAQIARDYQGDDIVWAITSNGVARFFARDCVWDTPKPDVFKLGTACYAVLQFTGQAWHVVDWNQKVPS